MIEALDDFRARVAERVPGDANRQLREAENRLRAGYGALIPPLERALLADMPGEAQVHGRGQP